MSIHNNTAPRILLIPGAWMGEWIWEPTVDQLRAQGLEAASLTLGGLEPGAVAHHVSSVRLERHVTQVADVILEWPDRPVVLEVRTDPNVPPLPPHITVAQAKAFMSTLLQGDPDQGSVLVNSAKEVLSGIIPGRKL